MIISPTSAVEWHTVCICSIMLVHVRKLPCRVLNWTLLSFLKVDRDGNKEHLFDHKNIVLPKLYRFVKLLGNIVRLYTFQESSFFFKLF